MSNLRVLPRGFIFIMASLTAITPLAIDAYLPAFLTISSDFGSDISSIEASLSIYLLGFSLGQLIGGPASDRYGRKITINTGLTLFTVFSLLIGVSSTSDELFLFRFFQALGGGAAVVNSAAVVRDNFEGKRSASTLSLISSIMMVAPMIAPTLGAFILGVFGWRYIFFFLGTYALLVMYLIRAIPESSPKSRDDNPFANYLKVLSRKRAIFLISTTSFAMGGMFIFITKSSYIYMDVFSLSSSLFTLFFALNIVTLIVLSRFNVYLLKKFSQKKLISIGITMQVVAALLLTIFSALDNYLFITVALLMLFIGSIGLIFGNSLSLVLDFFHTISGTANAIVGVMGYATSAFLGFLATQLPRGLEYVFAFMLATALLSSLFFTLNMLSSKKR